jgi:integrase
MAIIEAKQKRGKVYRVRVRDSIGRWHPCKTFARKVDAVRHERELITLNDKGVEASSIESRNKSVQEFLSEWIRHRDVSDGWRISQDQMLRDYIAPAIGSRKMTSICPMDISNVLSHMASMGRGPQTRRHVYNILRKMFSDAVENDLLLKSPVKRQHCPKIPKRHRTYLKPEDARKLLVESRNSPYGAAIWLGVLSGLRPGEIIALQWDSVDLELGKIQIRRDYKKKVRRIEDNPKQGDWGRAPMPPELCEYLRIVRQEKRSDVFVACNPLGEMMSYEGLLNQLTRLCKQASVSRITPHEMRHTATGMYLDMGATVEEVRKLLNHASPSTTMTYVHDVDRRLTEIASKVRVSNLRVAEA